MRKLKCNECAHELCADISFEPGDPCTSCSNGVFEYAPSEKKDEKETVLKQQTGGAMRKLKCNECYNSQIGVARYNPGDKCPWCKNGTFVDISTNEHNEKETVPEIIKSNVYREYLLYVDSYIRARFYWVLSSTSRKEKLMTDLIDKADSIMSVPIQLGPESIPNRARAMCSIAIAIDDAQTGTSIVVCSSFVDFRDRMNRMFGTEDDQ